MFQFKYETRLKKHFIGQHLYLQTYIWECLPQIQPTHGFICLGECTNLYAEVTISLA